MPYNRLLLEDYLDSEEVMDDVREDIPDDVSHDKLIVTLMWDYNPTRLQEVKEFNFERFLKFISRKIQMVDMFSELSAPEFSVAVRFDYTKPQDDDFMIVTGDILKRIQNLAQNVANINHMSISSRSRLNFIIRMTFDVTHLRPTGFERFYKQMQDIVGALRELLKYGSVFMPYESLATSSVGIAYKTQNKEYNGIGGHDGMPIEIWNRKTLKRLYGILTGDEPEEEPDDRKHAIRSQLSMPRIYKLFYQLNNDTKAQTNYDYRFIGYDDLQTFTKTVYIYLIPKNTSSVYGEFFSIIDWFKENIIDKTNKYDEQEVIGNSSSVTVEIKVSCDGYRPVRTDKKKELKFETKTASGLIWKIMFYDGDWDRFGQAKRGGRMFSNGLLYALSANRNFRNDVEAGYFGKYAQQHAEEETKIKK